MDPGANPAVEAVEGALARAEKKLADLENKVDEALTLDDTNKGQ